VKPGNIVVGPDGSVHLVDFGIARIVGKVPLTDDRAIVGTPEFLAPELLDGEPAGPGTDLWALGVTLYYALTGEAPFSAETKWAMFTAIKFRNPPQPRDGGPLAGLVLQMLRKRPEDRPDAATVSAVLRGVASQPDQPSTPSFRPVLQEPPARRRGTAPPVGIGPRLSALSGLPVLTQAQVVAGMPTDQAAGELLALSTHEAARIINRCDDALGGSLLSVIAQERAATARGILQMLPPDRHGPLLDHMSSVALAAVLALPQQEEIMRILDRAGTASVVGALSEMPPVRAASLVMAMDAGSAARALEQVAPTRIADILRAVSPVSRRQELLSRLPERLRASVRRYLGG
jgi:flagellar motility protein MotE (MotC chaperone)